MPRRAPLSIFIADFPQPLTVATAIMGTLNSSLPEHTKRRLISDLRSTAKMLALPAGAVPLTPEHLRDKLLRPSAIFYGIGEKRLRNIRSSLRFVLRAAGVIDKVDTAVSAPWQDLLAFLERRKRAEVIGLARFCSARQIGPHAVTAETLEAFGRQTIERTISPKPRKRIGDLRSFWNRAARTVPGWPPIQIPGGRSHDYILPPGAFTESFRKDLTRFGDRLTFADLDDEGADDLANDDSDDDRSDFTPLKPSSAALRQDHLRWAASALVATGGRATGDITSVGDLVRPAAHAIAILRFLYRRAGKRPSPAGMHVLEALLMVAKYDAKVPIEDVKKVRVWSKKLTMKYKEMTGKNEKTVLEASVALRDMKLLYLPELLMENAQKIRSSSPSHAASQALRAVGVEILTKTPLRLGELISLRLDRHLQRPDPKLRRISHIFIPAEERKNGVAYSVAVSKETGELLEKWITTFRSIMASPECVYLFPGSRTGNRPITPQGLRDAIKSVTRTEVGVAISPHQFRHLAGYHLLKKYPGKYGLVTDVLGHADPRTASRSYVRLENEAAHQILDDNVLERKSGRVRRRR